MILNSIACLCVCVQRHERMPNYVCISLGVVGFYLYRESMSLSLFSHILLNTFTHTYTYTYTCTYAFLSIALCV